MFDLTLIANENGGKIIYENCSFVCRNRNIICELAKQHRTIMMSNHTIFFETEEEMYNFASKIAKLK